jgi:hypothetical protein
MIHPDCSLMSRTRRSVSPAFGEASNALAVVELPTNAQKPTHTQSLRHSFFQAVGATREGSHCRPRCPPAFLSFCSSFLSLCQSPAFHREILRLDRLETTIANSVDPLHPRFCLSSCTFPFPRVDRCRHLIVSREILPFSDLRCTAFPAVSSASSHRQRFRSESRLVDQDSQGYEFCACGTG